MILRSTFLQRQKGVVLVLVALGLVVLIGAAALAIDLSHAYVNKTRLQNLADSLALSAAISLNRNESSQTAQNYATTNTYPAVRNSPGNQEILSANLNVTYTFAVDYSGPYVGATTPDNPKKHFARVEVAFPGQGIATWFAGIMGVQNIAVSASAVAGVTPIMPCDVVPIMMCAYKDPSTGIDKDCSDNNCYGYQLNTNYCLRQAASGNTSETDCPSVPNEYLAMGAGNFALLDFGDNRYNLPFSGANAIRYCMAGDAACRKICTLPPGSNNLPQVASKTGVNAGPVAQGLNTRFDDFSGVMNNTWTTPPGYYPDKLVSNPATISTNAQAIVVPTNPQPTPTNIYQNGYVPLMSDPTAVTANPSHNPQYLRRVVSLAFVDCSGFDTNGDGVVGPGDAGGSHDLDVVGFGCFFLTSPINQGKGLVYGEFIGMGPIGTKICNGSGDPNSTYDFNYYKVQLYKDPLPSPLGSRDS